MVENVTNKVEPFDLRDFLPYLLTMAAEQSSLAFQQVYKSRYGMLRTEWRVLFHLGRYGAMTAKAIRDRSGIHKTKVSRAVAALNARGYVRRETQDHDRRFETLTLNPAGQRVFDDLVAAAARHNTALMHQLSEDETAVLTACLRRLAHLPDAG